jgi:hypothetical protein
MCYWNNYYFKQYNNQQYIYNYDANYNIKFYYYIKQYNNNANFNNE